MKNKFSLLLLLLLSVNLLFAQDINKMDAAGKRHGLWRGTYEKSKKPRYEGTFDHGKEVGTFKFFEDNKTSTVYATRTFSSDGSCLTTFLDEKGKTVSQGKEINKLKEGKWLYYHPDGKTVMSEELYTRGKQNGIRKVYFINGNLAEEAAYAHDLREGPYKKYNEKGVLLEEATYAKDKLNGPATYRNPQGEIVSKGQYANDKKTGIWQFFEKGKLVKKEDLTNYKVQVGRKERKN